jgi:ubiquinone/menaquinone biosynthesis C-methylase UbiE
MYDEIFFEIHKDLSRESPGRDKYTKRAFKMIPPIKNPKILDIGCGPGVPTVLLAKLSYGEVIGMDTHQPYLDELERRAKDAKLSHRLKTLNCSMMHMDFPLESFDIIWSEGSIYIIGFIEGLKQWKKLLKPKGFLAVHEMVWLRDNPPSEIMNYWKRYYPSITTIKQNLEMISKCEYKLFGHFPLPDDAWWEGYYQPLEKRIKMLKKKYENDQKALERLETEEEEITIYKKYKKWYGSAFFIMQKK